MIYLDTHVVTWLYDRKLELLSERVVGLLEEEELYISPMVLLELQYLHEIKRLKDRGEHVYRALFDQIDLKVCEISFPKIIKHALNEKWVRDPFDRIIVAHARAQNAPLVTKDEQIQKHYTKAVW